MYYSIYKLHEFVNRILTNYSKHLSFKGSFHRQKYVN